MTCNQTGHILKMQMVHGNMSNPRVLAIAGPNGSGKSTIAKKIKKYGKYINADDLKVKYALTDIEAAQKAENLRNDFLRRKADFTFETVLSTDRNLILLEEAQKSGYQVHCIYVLTKNVAINIARVKGRVLDGGHDVPEGKIRSRFEKAMKLLPRLIEVCDFLLIYDNSTDDDPSLILKKEEKIITYYQTDIWSIDKIIELLQK